MREDVGALSGMIPVHVAIIMDGNGRWAVARGLPRTAGHRKGVEAVRGVVAAAQEMGIRYVTLFGFSSENWRRPDHEVSDLMGLLRFYLRSHIADLHSKNVCLRVIGERARLPPDVVALIEKAEQTTRENDGVVLTIALSYGARAEIVAAAKHLAVEAAAGRLDPAAIDETMFGKGLLTEGLPDPDLVIRTRAANSASVISCYGSPPIPSWCLSIPSGPISPKAICRRR